MSGAPAHVRWARAAATAGRRMIVGEAGAGHTIGYLLVLPFYLVTVYVIVEMCLMHNAMVGATYAAYAAARAAAVRPGEATSSAAVERAAVLAFIPFAHSVAGVDADRGRAEEDQVVRLHAAAAGQAGFPVTAVSRLRRQVRYATRAVHTTVTTKRRGKPWEEDVEVVVTYDFPFSLPIVGRLLGTRTADGRYVWPVEATATLPMENPANEQRSLGIKRQGD